jgi:5,10-methylenetetrahydrofolate reductase
VRPLVSFEKAASCEKFFGISVSERLKAGLKVSGRLFGINFASQLIMDLRREGAAGVHIFALNDTELLQEILKRIK